MSAESRAGAGLLRSDQLTWPYRAEKPHTTVRSACGRGQRLGPAAGLLPLQLAYSSRSPSRLDATCAIFATYATCAINDGTPFYAQFIGKNEGMGAHLGSFAALSAGGSRVLPRKPGWRSQFRKWRSSGARTARCYGRCETARPARGSVGAAAHRWPTPEYRQSLRDSSARACSIPGSR